VLGAAMRQRVEGRSTKEWTMEFFWFVDGIQREMDMARLMMELEKRVQVE
jgi:hypothetical protein